MNEKWKIVEEDRRYEISTEGRVRRDGKPFDAFGTSRGGYRHINISGNRIRKIHRLVAEAFIQRQSGKPLVLHSDGNPINNCVSNLRWGTHQDNADDRGTHRMHTTGERSSLATVTEQDVRECHAGYAHFKGSMHAYARAIGRNREWVRQILKGERWKHLGLPAYE